MRYQSFEMKALQLAAPPSRSRMALTCVISGFSPATDVVLDAATGAELRGTEEPVAGVVLAVSGAVLSSSDSAPPRDLRAARRGWLLFAEPRELADVDRREREGVELVAAAAGGEKAPPATAAARDASSPKAYSGGPVPVLTMRGDAPYRLEPGVPAPSDEAGGVPTKPAELGCWLLPRRLMGLAPAAPLGEYAAKPPTVNGLPAPPGLVA
jgi:hypothetical protein